MGEWPDFKAMHSKDLEDLHWRLLLATEGRLRRCRWHGQSNTADGPGGMQAGDFVQSAFRNAMTGQRSWNSEVSLFQNLWQIISSEISHAMVSYENRHTTIENIDDEKIINIKNYRQGADALIELQEERSHILNYLHAEDSDAALVATAVIDLDITRSLEMSVHLAKSVREIENIKKRLRRLIKRYLDTDIKTRKASKRAGDL